MGNVLARCNGTEIVARDGELWIVEKPSPPHVASAVLALLAFIALVNGVIRAIMGVAAREWTDATLAAILFVLGGVFLRVLIAVRRSAAARSAEDREPSLIIAGGTLFDGQRRKLAALADVRADKVMQLTSSSRALALAWPAGKRIIARGNPFGDSVHGCEHVLRSHGIAAR